jgi:hypothetical protein
MKHIKNNTLNGFKETTEQGAVLQKEMSEFRINGKNTVAVRSIDNLKRHSCSAGKRILDTTGGTEAAVTAKRHKFKSAASGTSIHCTSKRRIATINHAVNIFNNRISWV